jgi:hypothetical protein
MYTKSLREDVRHPKPLFFFPAEMVQLNDKCHLNP